MKLEPANDMAEASDGANKVVFVEGKTCWDCALRPDLRCEAWPYECLPCSEDQRKDGKDGAWLRQS